MFTNIGGKIRKLSVCLTVAGMIAAVVAAAAIWENNTFGSFTVLLSPAILVAGMLAAWIGSFFIYGFGEMIEKTAQNNHFLAQLLQQTKGNKAKSGYAPAPARPAENNRWKCSRCGEYNQAGSMFCRGCGKYK